MNDAQKTLADAYARIDQPVLDDLVAHTRAIPDPAVRAGAMTLLLYVFDQRSRKRRSAMSGKRETKRGV